MGSLDDGGKAEIFFLPWIIGRSHLIPMIDTARIFAANGAKVTIITTPFYAELFRKPIDRDRSVLGHDIRFHTFKVPTAEFGLPEGSENLPSPPMGVMTKLFMAIAKVQEPIEQFLSERRPDCIVSDMFWSWTSDAGERLGIPRILFQVTGVFPPCCEDVLRRHAPHRKVNSDKEPFPMPGLPNPNSNIFLTRSRINAHFLSETDDWGKYLEIILEAERKCYGVMFNSFYDMESAYADYHENVIGKKLWLVGPGFLFNKNVDEKAERGEKSSVDGASVLSWLDSKDPNSVIYVSFGSHVSMAPAQFLEIAHGLEASGCQFVWVARGIDDKMLPEGFGERMSKSGQGLLVRSWAPQLLILEHAAVGGFLTHCGWNSTIEGIGAGLPMITWPLACEQFFTESLITDVLKTGIRVGNEEWLSLQSEPKVTVTSEKVEAAVKWLMGGGGGEVEEMRRRAKELGEKAKKAPERGGSSHADAISLIDDLKSRRRSACANKL